MSSSPNTGLETLKSYLFTHVRTKHIEFQIIDYGSTPRCRVVPLARALQIAETGKTDGVSTTSPILYAGAPFEIATYGANPGEDHWVADWTTLKPVAGKPRHAWVACSVKECVEGSESYLTDPRTILRRVEESSQKAGIEFQIGYEVEYILSTTGSANPLDIPPTWLCSAALRHPSFSIVEESVDHLEEEADIPIWQFHQEGPSMFEIPLSPSTPLLAVDNLAFTHETIKTIASKHEMHASFHPNAFESGPPVGQHIHLSLSRPEEGDHFLAGLLEHLPALTAFTNGGYDSGGRQNQYGSGNVVWGTTKLLPVRRIGEAHYELRFPDTLTNPYLQLAAVLIAGMDGVKKQMELTITPSDWIDVVSFKPMPQEKREELGVTKSLPENLEESLKALKEDSEVFKKGLGEKSFDTYVEYREREFKGAQMTTIAQRRKIMITNI